MLVRCAKTEMKKDLKAITVFVSLKSKAQGLSWEEDARECSHSLMVTYTGMILET